MMIPSIPSPSQSTDRYSGARLSPTLSRDSMGFFSKQNSGQLSPTSPVGPHPAAPDMNPGPTHYTVNNGYDAAHSAPVGPNDGALATDTKPGQQELTSEYGMGNHQAPTMHSGTNPAPAPLTGGTPISPTSSPTSSIPTIRQANKLERKARVEETMGGLFCNSAMKARGHHHAAQAHHLRMQVNDLGEAQRLEAEAGMRRQRAVGLGADPAHATGTTGYDPDQ